MTAVAPHTIVDLDNPDSLNKPFEQMRDNFQNADYRDVLGHEVVPLLSGVHEDYFNQEAGPEGPWAALKERTIKKKGFDTVLIESNYMRSSLLFTGAPDHVEDIEERYLTWGTSDPKAAIHQDGAPQKNIPARPFVGLNDAPIDQITDLIADETVEIILG
jgi:phage gpG-like protein